MTAARQTLGAAGEELAARWYQANGYQVVTRNWRCREGELDLVVRRGRAFVFCEVKARTTAAFGVPAEAVTKLKRQRLRVLASRWLDESRVRPASIRFDVAAVLAGELEIIEGAF